MYWDCIIWSINLPFHSILHCILGQLTSSFIFYLWNQLRIDLVVHLGSLSCWEIHSGFTFSPQILMRTVLAFFPSCRFSITLNLPLPYAEQQTTSWCIRLQTSLCALKCVKFSFQQELRNDRIRFWSNLAKPYYS